MAGLEETLGQLLSDPAAMGQIMGLAKSLGLSPEGGDGAPSDPPPEGTAPPPPPLDGHLPELLTRLLAGSSRSDPRQQALLSALKPYVRPERRAGIDRALRIARLSRLAGDALREFGAPRPGEEPEE